MPANPRFAEQLRALDLSRVAITAALDAAGNLAPVAGLFGKLGAAVDQAAAAAWLKGAEAAAKAGELRFLVVSSHQAGVPPEWLREDAFPLRIIQAATLEEAVERLYEEDGPRAAVRQYERHSAAGLELIDQQVPLERHYQVPVLLRQIKRPRRRGDATAAAERADEHEPLRCSPPPADPAPVVYQRCSLAALFSDFRRAVPEARSDVPRLAVLGLPGSGKSTLLQYLAYGTAAGQLRPLGRAMLPVRISLRRWEEEGHKLPQPEAGLPEYLAQCYRLLTPAPTAAHWHRWLHHGEVLLLLDGLDEIEGRAWFGYTFKRALAAVKDCPLVVTCRHDNPKALRDFCPELPVFLLPDWEDEQRDDYVRQYPAGHPEQFAVPGLLAQLQGSPAMRALAAKPLLLAIVCCLVDDRRGLRLPVTRGELYDKLVDCLLGRPRRVDVGYPSGRGDLPSIRKRRILERTALTLFAAAEPCFLFDEGRLCDALAAGLAAEGLVADAAELCDSLLADLAHNSRLLRGDAQQGYCFLHPSVQEFLAAAGLARLANKKGWDWPPELPGVRQPLGPLLDQKAWDPQWQEMVCFLAGLLDDPARLLEMLCQRGPTAANPCGDDCFRHRLALAALCTAEVPLHRRGHARVSALFEQIATGVFPLCWEYSQKGRSLLISHLERALPSLGEVNAQVPPLFPLDDGPAAAGAGAEAGAEAAAHAAVGKLPLLDRLVELLQHDDARFNALGLLGKIGRPAATPQVLDLLGALADSGDVDLSFLAFDALARLGAAATAPQGSERALFDAEPGPLPALAECEQFPNSSAADALGPIQLPAEIAAELVNGLGDADPPLRSALADALGGTGASTPRPEVVARLLALSSDPHPLFQHAALEALRRWLDQGFRFFCRPDGGWEVRSVAELGR